MTGLTFFDLICFTLKFGLVIGLNTCGVIYAHYTAHKYLKEPYTPLYDVLHNYAPKLPLHLPDFLLVFLIVYLLMFSNTFEYALLIKQLNTLFYSLLLRPVFICSTTLPTCMKERPITKLSIYEQLFNSSHDLMFSGHSCVIIFFCKIIDNKIGYIMQFPLPLIMSLSRQHYTIDVLVAYIVYNYIEMIT